MPPLFQGNADQQTRKRTGPYSRMVAEGPDGLEPDPILVNPDHQKDGEGSKPGPANLVRGQTQLVVAVASAILAGLLEYQKYRRAALGAICLTRQDGRRISAALGLPGEASAADRSSGVCRGNALRNRGRRSFRQRQA